MERHKPTGDVIEAGDLRLSDGRIRYGVAIRFPTADALRAALRAGRAEFTVFGGAPEQAQEEVAHE